MQGLQYVCLSSAAVASSPSGLVQIAHTTSMSSSSAIGALAKAGPGVFFGLKVDK